VTKHHALKENRVRGDPGQRILRDLWLTSCSGRLHRQGKVLKLPPNPKRQFFHFIYFSAPPYYHDRRKDTNGRRKKLGKRKNKDGKKRGKQGRKDEN